MVRGSVTGLCGALGYTCMLTYHFARFGSTYTGTFTFRACSFSSCCKKVCWQTVALVPRRALVCSYSFVYSIVHAYTQAWCCCHIVTIEVKLFSLNTLVQPLGQRNIERTPPLQLVIINLHFMYMRVWKQVFDTLAWK